MRYPQIDRRMHQVFLTRNTEYHVRKNLCVGVRDRKSGRWHNVHLALKAIVEGGLRFTQTGNITPNKGRPRVGESLLFQAGEREVVTSTVMGIERPTPAVVAQYRF